MYIPAQTLARAAYYISNLIVSIHKYILLLLPYCSTIPTIAPIRIAHVNTYYRESNPLNPPGDQGRLDLHRD